MELYTFSINLLTLAVLSFSLGYKFGLKDGRPRWFNEGYSAAISQPQGGGEDQGQDTSLDNDDAKAR